MRKLATRFDRLRPGSEAELQELRVRVARLEDEVKEAHRFNRRLAELADIVQELLVPATNRDDERLRQLLDDYSKRL